MALQTYLGNKAFTEIRANVIKVVEEFNKQNDATKLKLATQNKLELEMFKQGTAVIIDAFDETSKELEEAGNKNEYYKRQYGEVD